MSKETIAVDIDDVLADSTEAYRIRVNEQTGALLSSEHYRVEGEYWGYYERIWRQHDLAVDIDELDQEMIEDQSRIPLLPGAELALGQLLVKFQLVLVTARNPLWETSTRKWLEQHFGETTPDLFFSEAHSDPAKRTKGQICKELGATWLIDDNPQHCQSAMDEGVTPILFGSYGWHYEVPADIQKCETWQEVLEFFESRS